MKKLFAFMAVLMLLPAMGGAVFAQQTTVTVGNWSGTTSSYYGMFENYYRNSYTQTIYPVASLGGASYIRALVLDNRSTASVTYTSLKIYMGHRSASSSTFSSTSDWTAESDLQLVYQSSDYTVPATTGELLIPLSTAFAYNGTDNLVIAVSKQTPTYSSSCKFGYTSTSNGYMYRRSDSDTNYSHYPGTATGTRGSYVENIKLVTTANAGDAVCFNITGLNVVSLDEQSITAGWEAQAGALYDVAIVEQSLATSADDVTPTTVNATSYTFTGLQSNTAYRIYARVLCSGTTPSGWDSLTVTTSAVPNALPFFASFEDSTYDSQWVLRNVDASHSMWMIGDSAFAGDATEGRSLYVTTGTTGANVYTNQLSRVFAATLLNFGTPGSYDIAFDWRGMGVGTTHYMRAVLVPAQLFADYQAGTTAMTGFSATATPSGAIAVDNGGVLNLQQDWQHFRNAVDIAAAGNYYLCFFWYNTATAPTNPAAAVDNVMVQQSTCSRPTACTVTGITPTDAVLNITHADATAFIMGYRKVGSSRIDTVSITGNSYTFVGLTPGTSYEGMVYTACGSDTSYNSKAFSFTTECGALDLPVVLDAEHNWSGTTTAPSISCWTFLNHGNTTYSWRSSTTNYHDGARPYYYYGTTSTTATYAPDDWMITPEIVFTGNDQMTLWVKTGSATTTTTYHGRFAIYATTAGNSQYTDTAHFYQLALSGDGVTNNRVDFVGNTWQQITLQLPNSLTDTHRLAFVVNTQSYTFYMDDIEIFHASSCPTIADVTVDAANITTSTAHVHWTDTANTGSYQVLCWPENARSGDTVTVSTTDTSTTLTGLQPGTYYYVSVVGVCPGEQSNPTYPVEFLTYCLPIADSLLPYTETFEAYGNGAAYNISPCWRKGTNSSTNYPYPSSASAITGSRGLYFYSTATYYCYAVLPEFESDVDQLMVEFDIKRYTVASYKTQLLVGVMSDPLDIETFDTVQLVDFSTEPVSSAHHVRVNLENYAGTGTHIAFMTPKVSTNYVYLDNVQVNLLPTCRWPLALEVGAVDSTTVTLSWSGSAQDFEIQYATDAAFTQNVGYVSVVGDTTGTITGLASFTIYYARVRSICTPDTSLWSSVVSFRTAIDCGTDYEHTVQTFSFGNSSSGMYPIYAAPASEGSYVNPCLSWFLYTPAELINLGLVDSINTIHSVFFEIESSSNLAHPFRMWMAETPLESFGSISDTLARANMQLVFDGSFLFTPNSWNEVVLDSAFNYTGNGSIVLAFERVGSYVGETKFKYGSLPSGTNRIAYKYGYSGMYGSSTSANVTYLHHHNIGFRVCKHVPACAVPTDAHIVHLAHDTVTVAWSGTAGSYNVLVSPTPVDPDTVSAGSAMILTASDTVIDITGLTQGTTYYYYLQSVCGADITGWTLARTFKVPCAPQALPYSEDFDSYQAGTSAAAGQTISPCWTKGTSLTTDYPYLYTTNAYSAPNGMYFWGSTAGYSYAALPRMADSVHNLAMSFMIKKTSAAYGKMRIGVMTDPGDASTFMLYKHVSADVLNEWEYKEVDFSNYTGPEGFIAFLVPDTGSNSVIIDDVLVDVLPPCRHVENVRVTGITSSTAVVKWEDPMNATNHEIEYGMRGFMPGTGTVVTSTADSVVLTGLPIGERLSVRVRTLCNATDTSTWSVAVTFATDCAPLQLPIVMDFENETSGTGNTVERSLCWRRLNNVAATATYAYYPYINTGTNAHGGNKFLYMYFGTSSTYPDDIAYATPEIDTASTPMNRVEVSFWAKRNTNATSITVGVMSDQANLSTFVPVDTFELSTTYQQYFADFSNYTGNGSYIALRHVRTSTVAEYIYLDDIAIYRAAPCPRVFNLGASNATDSSAVLAWSDTIGSTSWRVELTNLATNAVDTLTASDTIFRVTGLTPRTNYSFRVAPVCASGEISEYTFEGYRFGTAQVPAAVPYSYDFEDATEWANWQTSSSSYIGWYRGNIAQGNTSNAMYISADGGQTHSWNVNYTSNVLAWRDIDFGTDTGSYTLSFDAYIGGTQNNYNGISIAVVDPAVYVEDNSTYYQTPWGHVNDISLAQIRRDTNWGYHTVNIDGVTGVRRVVFYHYTYSSTATFDNNPPAVDNISIVRQLCERPGNLEADSVTTTTALISWMGDPSASYTIDYRPTGTTGTDQFVTVTGNSGTIANMQPATMYSVWVRKNCSDTLSSTWSNSIRITTACGAVSVRDTLREGFELQSGSVVASVGEVPPCWSSWHDGSNDYKPHVMTATSTTASYPYSVSGTNSLMFYNSSTTYGQNSMARMVEIEEPTNTLTLSYWICTYNQSGTMQVGYMTGDNFATDFVLVKSIAASAMTEHSGSGLQPAGHGVYDTVHFDSIPDGNYRIAFRWVSSGTSLMAACIDDISVWSSYTCYPPTLVSAIGDYQSDTITVNGTGIAYQIAYGTEENALNDTLTVSSAVIPVTGLAQNTTYYFAVRQQCDSVRWSNWTRGSFTTDEMPCMAPATPTVSDVTYTGATIAWEPGLLQNKWLVHLTGINTDRNDTISTAPTITYTDLVQGGSYSVEVRALCGDDFSPWTEAASFTTTNCQPVSDVSISDITATSVKVSWTNGDNEGSGEWSIEYGYTGFSRGEGTTVTSQTNPYTIGDLEPNTQYDVYVASVCGDGMMSVWSQVATFTTAEGEGIDGVASDGVALYPNPATGSVTLSVAVQSTVNVIDLSGREVLRAECHEGTNQINLEGVASGAYYVRIVSEQATAIRKLIVR